MGDFVHAEPAASAAGAFRIVEDKVFGFDSSVNEMVRWAAQALIETLPLGLGASADYLNLNQAVAHQQSRGDSSFDGLFVSAADHEPVDDRIDITNTRTIDIDFRGDVNRLSIDEQEPATLLADLCEYEVQLFAVNLKHGS